MKREKHPTLEKHLSLSRAASLIGVSHHTLKDWLRKDLGILIPRVRRGAKTLVRERDVQRVLEMRRDARTAI
jgi:predicted site-specific integrase-resolvase